MEEENRFPSALFRSGIRQYSEEYGYFYTSVHGTPYPPFIKEEVVDELRSNFCSREDDVFVVTYPKAGTTWMQAILLLLIHEGDGSKVSPHPALQKQAPWLEASFKREEDPLMAGPRPMLDEESLEQMEGPRRVFKSHAPFPLFPVHNTNLHTSTKIVYVTRNPIDVAVSLFHHSSSIPVHGFLIFIFITFPFQFMLYFFTFIFGLNFPGLKETGMIFIACLRGRRWKVGGGETI